MAHRHLDDGADATVVTPDLYEVDEFMVDAVYRRRTFPDVHAVVVGNLLRNAGVRTMEDLRAAEVADFAGVPGIGRVRSQQLRDALAALDESEVLA